MEARIARLESDVGHLRSDVAEIKVDVRSLRDRIDAVGSQLNARIDAVGSQLSAKIDQYWAQSNAKAESLAGSIASAKTWALTLYIALAAVMLGTMARGFGWV